MPDDRPEKPSRTVWFETGMAMTMSCSPSRETGALPQKQAPANDEGRQQRGTAK
ncbi:hypothetical protein [Acidisphaera sp. L21]|uniref:hypothetical protein n=1 Tax=Acidisphaera sp. L21 TaxID=1641851 RepID=UPI00131E5D79|nr:hypothetical protein [Acidisphaera sp. L21]